MNSEKKLNDVNMFEPIHNTNFLRIRGQNRHNWNDYCAKGATVWMQHMPQNVHSSRNIEKTFENPHDREGKL